MTTKESMALPDGAIITPVEPLLSKEQLKQFDFSQLQNNMLNQMHEQLMSPIKNNLDNVSSPEERLKFLIDKINSIQTELTVQTEALQSSRYENMKLNAQIDTLNKTIDSNENKLDELRTTNSKLGAVNATLKRNNNHYWRNTFIVTFIVALIFFILGLLIP